MGSPIMTYVGVWLFAAMILKLAYNPSGFMPKLCVRLAKVAIAESKFSLKEINLLCGR